MKDGYELSGFAGNSFNAVSATWKVVQLSKGSATGAWYATSLIGLDSGSSDTDHGYP